MDIEAGAGAEGPRPDGAMRLQRFLARSGVASRRASEDLIVSGRVSVNGESVFELGTKVDPSCDRVTVDGIDVVLPVEHTTLMLHKPAGYVTTMTDPHGRSTVAELVPTERFAGLYPVGRLDIDTTGLLLFSTDGELGNALLHPSRHVVKRYFACVSHPPTHEELDRLARGVWLDDGMTAPAEVELLSGSSAGRAERAFKRGRGASGCGESGGKMVRAWQGRDAAFVQISIIEGRKRQVRRMLEAVGNPAIALHRDSFGPLSLGGLARGEWRKLSTEEIERLKKGARG